jgi:hypothetical protein
MTRDPTDRLQELLDREDILDCLARYCRGVDRLDEETLVSAFHEDGVDWHGQFVGSPREFFVWVSGRQAPGLASQHYVTNALIELDGDVAHVESYVLTAVRLKEGTGVSLSGGRYADRFERRDGLWRIALRVCVGEWRASADGTGSDVFEREGYALGARDRTDISFRRPLTAPGSPE